MLNRWRIYQRERFPLIAYALLAAMFAWSALAFSALLRGAHSFAVPQTWLAAAVSALLVFAQMRALDEIKDFADDSLYRPYRAVPRGLVTLGELRWIAAAAAALQLVIALSVDPRLAWLLACVWVYLTLMTVEFFVPDWLKARPLAYLASHTPLAGLLAFYLTAFDWLVMDTTPSPALLFFCAASIMATTLLEIGRKIRTPQDEEAGVVTYTAAWGYSAAVTAWFIAFALMLICGGIAAHAAGLSMPFTALQLPVAAAVCAFGLLFLSSGSTRRARQLEAVSGIAVLMLYLGLGPVYMIAMG